ncbi:hypothetical protein [Nocardia sp. NPDC058480]|uniref:hypothetical protein n=1 Tax=Nocardia sp. NPDC058480 TaxID=3346522 RepID=UPI0036521D85
MSDWVGESWGELTPDQQQRMNQLGDDVGKIWSDPDDQPTRDVALAAGLDYMLDRESVAVLAGDSMLETFGDTLASCRRDLQYALARCQIAAVLASEDGVPETRIAHEAGVDRMTVRKWLGKR